MVHKENRACTRGEILNVQWVYMAKVTNASQLKSNAYFHTLMAYSKMCFASQKSSVSGLGYPGSFHIWHFSFSAHGLKGWFPGQNKPRNGHTSAADREKCWQEQRCCNRKDTGIGVWHQTWIAPESTDQMKSGQVLYRDCTSNPLVDFVKFV